MRTWLLSGVDVVDGSEIARVSKHDAVMYASSGRQDCQASCACPVFWTRGAACHSQLESGCLTSLRLMLNIVLCCCSCADCHACDCCASLEKLACPQGHARECCLITAAALLAEGRPTAVISTVQLPVFCDAFGACKHCVGVCVRSNGGNCSPMIAQSEWCLQSYMQDRPVCSCMWGEMYICCPTNGGIRAEFCLGADAAQSTAQALYLTS
jgi:hypothetical protein